MKPIRSKTLRNLRVFQLRDDGLSHYAIREALAEEGWELITAERVRQILQKKEKQP